MEFLGINEAARQLGVHENTVRRWADQGLIRTVRLPSGTRRIHGSRHQDSSPDDVQGLPGRTRRNGPSARQQSLSRA